MSFWAMILLACPSFPIYIEGIEETLQEKTEKVERFFILKESLTDPSLNFDRCGSKLRIKQFGEIRFKIDEDQYNLNSICAIGVRDYVLWEGYRDVVV
ncbi:hypothetical protein ACOME3_008291 [Neoechinorhynchus agilis]